MLRTWYSQDWPWPYDPLASSSGVLVSQLWTTVQVLGTAGAKPGVLCMLANHSTNGVKSRALRDAFWKNNLTHLPVSDVSSDSCPESSPLLPGQPLPKSWSQPLLGLDMLLSPASLFSSVKGKANDSNSVWSQSSQVWGGVLFRLFQVKCLKWIGAIVN